MPKHMRNSILVILALTLSQAWAALPAQPQLQPILNALPGEYIGFDLEELGMRREVTCRVTVARIGDELLFRASSIGKNKVELEHVSPAVLAESIAYALKHPDEREDVMGREVFKTKFSKAGMEVGRIELTWNRVTGVFSDIVLGERSPGLDEVALYCGGLIRVNN